MLHSDQTGGRAISRWYTALASLAIVALTLAGSGLRPVSVRAQDAVKRQPAVVAQTTEGDLLQLIPPEIVDVVIEFDVAALLNSELAAQLLESTPDILKQTPFDIKTVDKGLVLLTAANNDPQTTPLVLLRFSPGAELPIAKPADESSKTTKTPAESFAADVRQIDSRTIVFGGSESLRSAIGKLPSDDHFRPLLERHQGKAIRIAGRITEFRREMSTPQESAMLAFSPL